MHGQHPLIKKKKFYNIKYTINGDTRYTFELKFI